MLTGVIIFIVGALSGFVFSYLFFRNNKKISDKVEEVIDLVKKEK